LPPSQWRSARTTNAIERLSPIRGVLADVHPLRAAGPPPFAGTPGRLEIGPPPHLPPPSSRSSPPLRPRPPRPPTEAMPVRPPVECLA
jgi:hypothetical protein